jgi:dihydrofolate reductase
VEENDMRKIIVEAEMTLDAIIDGGKPEFWGKIFQYHSPDVSAYLEDLLFLPDALLMGRATYEGFADIWPKREGKMAEHINAMPKYVASRTLNAPLAWNSTLLKGDAAEAIGKLKQEAGGDLLQYGIGELTETMLRHNLVDEVRLLVFPFTYGTGQHAFRNMDIQSLKLVDTKTFNSGVIALTYQPDR